MCTKTQAKLVRNSQANQKQAIRINQSYGNHAYMLQLSAAHDTCYLSGHGHSIHDVTLSPGMGAV